MIDLWEECESTDGDVLIRKHNADGTWTFLAPGDETAQLLNDLEARLAEAVAAKEAAESQVGMGRPLLVAMTLRAATAEAGAAAMRQALEDTLRDVPPEVWDALYSTRWHESPIMVALASDAGATLLAQMAAMRTALERCQAVFALITNHVSLGGAYETIRQVRQQSEAALAPDAGTVLLARLTRAEGIVALATAWRRVDKEAQGAALQESYAIWHKAKDAFVAALEAK